MGDLGGRSRLKRSDEPIIFPSRNLEPSNSTFHRALLDSNQVQQIYLDELGDPNQQPIGIRLMQLTIASEAEMVEQAKQLIDRVQQEEIAPIVKTAIIRSNCYIQPRHFVRNPQP